MQILDDMACPSAVLTTAIVALIWTIFTLSIRVYTRFRVNGPWASDDWAIAAATVNSLPFKHGYERTLPNVSDLPDTEYTSVCSSRTCAESQYPFGVGSERSRYHHQGKSGSRFLLDAPSSVMLFVASQALRRYLDARIYRY